VIHLGPVLHDDAVPKKIGRYVSFLDERVPAVNQMCDVMMIKKIEIGPHVVVENDPVVKNRPVLFGKT
jgi:hypothetical protein